MSKITNESDAYKAYLISKIDELNQEIQSLRKFKLSTVEQAVQHFKNNNCEDDAWKLLFYRYQLRDNEHFISEILQFNNTALQYATPRVQLLMRGVVCKHN